LHASSPHARRATESVGEGHERRSTTPILSIRVFPARGVWPLGGRRIADIPIKSTKQRDRPTMKHAAACASAYTGCAYDVMPALLARQRLQAAATFFVMRSDARSPHSTQFVRENDSNLICQYG
jgi:hypothetical protein